MHLTLPQKLILSEHSDNSLSNLIRHTLYELIQKDVLAIHKAIEDSNYDSDSTKFIFIVTSKNFHSYQGLSYEHIFLSQFQEDSTIVLSAQQVISKAFIAAHSFRKYETSIIQSLRHTNFYRKNIFGKNILTTTGEIAVQDIKKSQVIIPAYTIELNTQKLVDRIFLMVESELYYKYHPDAPDSYDSCITIITIIIFLVAALIKYLS